MNFKTFCESTFDELFDSAVAAFPNTKKRQHATDTIQISEMKFTPFVGVKTLFMKCRATNESRQYNPMILFKGVVYRDGKGKGVIPLKISESEIRYVEQLSRDDSEVLVRCDCNDFKWRFNYYDYLDRSLYGNKRKKYEGTGGPPANPQEKEGLCKHLMKMMYSLQESGLVS